MIYQNEIFQDISTGDKLKAYIKNVRKDGKIDISLQPIGKDNSIELDKENILKLLKTNDGFLPYTTKSDPQILKEFFGISKKAFKRALNELVLLKKVSTEEKGIKLN